MKTLAVTPWKTQNQELLEKAGTTVTTTSDEETLNTVLQQIDNENNRVIYLSFAMCWMQRRVEEAGRIPILNI